MGTVALRAEFDLSGVVLPRPCLTVPSMISVNERKLLYHIARDHYAGLGFIVDAGVFLGSSTLAFALALRDRPDGPALLERFRANGSKPVHAYDKCIATPHMIRFMREEGHPLAGSLRVGMSFLPLLARLTGAAEEFVELHGGDLESHTWRADDPIEILFVDVAKSLSLHEHVRRQFMPALRVGAYVIQQDFFFAELPWIKVTMAHLRDHFDFVGEAHASAVFKCKSTDWQGRLDRDPWDEASLDDLLSLHDSWIAETSDLRRRAMVELSSVRLMVDKGKVERATDRLRRVERAYAATISADTGSFSLAEKVAKTRAYVDAASAPAPCCAVV